mgnify:CR=1 FL=1
MKTSTVLLLILLASSNFVFGQVTQDTPGPKYIYAPNYANNSFSAEESWEIHKAAYIKQLKSKGLTDEQIKKSMASYEKDKKLISFTKLLSLEHSHRFNPRMYIFTKASLIGMKK